MLPGEIEQNAYEKSIAEGMELPVSIMEELKGTCGRVWVGMGDLKCLLLTKGVSYEG